jgi:hypothetical protein
LQIESHSTINSTEVLNITAVLDQEHYGFSKFTFHNASVATWTFVKGDRSGIGDTLTLIKKSNSSTAPPTPTGGPAGYYHQLEYN